MTKGDYIMNDEKINDFIILDYLKDNAKNDKLADFVIKIFMLELRNESWFNNCDSMLDDYIDGD